MATNLSDTDKRLKAVYDDGFNIYMMLNKLKKELGKKDNFPDALIDIFCANYWKYKPKNKYIYFLHSFKQASAQYNAEQSVKEGERHKKESKHTPKLMKEILKGMFGCALFFIVSGCITTDPFAGWDVVEERDREFDSYIIYELGDLEGCRIRRLDGCFDFWWKQRKDWNSE